MRPYITETWLRENFDLEHGTFVTVPHDARLTPSALGLVEERRLEIHYVDASGSTVNIEYPAGKDPEKIIVPDSVKVKVEVKETNASSVHPHINPLTGESSWHKAHCMLCNQEISKKPDTMTHLDKDILVPKNDKRLKFRGKLDSLIARIVLIQEEFVLPNQPKLSRSLAEIRSALGNVLKAEVTGEKLPEIVLGTMDSKKIHAISHTPLKYIGIDHFLPEVGRGVQVAKLNLLRAEIREAELIAADIFIAPDYTVTRPDIMEGLNRLSSAVYVLMMLVYLAEQGKPVDLEGISL